MLIIIKLILSEKNRCCFFHEIICNWSIFCFRNIYIPINISMKSVFIVAHKENLGFFQQLIINTHNSSSTFTSNYYWIRIKQSTYLGMYNLHVLGIPPFFPSSSSSCSSVCCMYVLNCKYNRLIIIDLCFVLNVF